MRFKEHFLLFAFCNVCICQYLAQNHASHWYFGNYAALTFSTAPPSLQNNSQMYAWEGTSSIADAAGNLLFYTDGITIWNKQHQVMANGTGLLADQSTTQAALIVRKPTSNNLYYVFTLASFGQPNGLNYSIVDLSLASGQGSVVTKNVHVQGYLSEKLAAVPHCNGLDIWILVHDHNSRVFRSYLLSGSGVSATAVLSQVGDTLSTAIGQMKFSPLGNKVAVAMPFSIASQNAGLLHMFDYDRTTGIVSKPVILHTGDGPYGCEFSPDGSKLYTGILPGPAIAQWDLCEANDSLIIASQQTISAPGSYVAAMQLAADGKIYVVAPAQTNALSIIHLPNQPAVTCSFVPIGLSLGTYSTFEGLPNFVSGFVRSSLGSITAASACQSATFSLPEDAHCQFNVFPQLQVKWNFGDPASGTANSSTLYAPQHYFTSAGTYTVHALLEYPCRTDTLRYVINTTPPPALQISSSASLQFTVCSGKSLTLAASGAHQYSWTGGSTGSTYTVTGSQSATFALAGLDTLTGCTSSEVFTVQVFQCLDIGTISLSSAGLNIFPNPVADTLNFSFPPSCSELAHEFVVHSVGGFVQYIPPAAVRSLYFGDRPDGVYFLAARSGVCSHTRRLVKMK